MSLLKVALFSLWILALSSLTLGEAFAQSGPTEEEATLESRFGIGFLLRYLIFIVIGAIAGITALVLWKRKLIF